MTTSGLASTLLSCVLLCAGYAHAIELPDLGVSQDKSLSATQRIERLFHLLTSEVSQPTTPHEGFGGPIDHDYVMAQIIKAFWHVAKDSAEARRYLVTKIQDEKNDEVREAVDIGLAQCGDKAFSSRMVKIIKGSRGVWVRGEALQALMTLHSARNVDELLRKVNDVELRLAIQELQRRSHKHGPST